MSSLEIFQVGHRRPIETQERISYRKTHYRLKYKLTLERKVAKEETKRVNLISSVPFVALTTGSLTIKASKGNR